MPSFTPSGEAEAPTALLLEQLLQIARISALEATASGIAHELNQPIGAITTFAQAGKRLLDRPDRLRIQLALFAFVQNALDAPTPNEEPHNVRIELPGDRYGVQVTVADRGVGVAEEARERAR